MKILYIGCGEHFDIIKHFTECNEFILVDSRPLNQYGYDYYNKQLYNSSFVNKIITLLKDIEFNLIHTNVLTNEFPEILRQNLESTKLVFENGNKKVNYYISTSIPHHLYLNELKDDIRSCDTLLISGHHPSYQILDYLPPSITFIGYSVTWYPNPNNFYKDEYNCINAIINKKINVKDFILVDFTTGVKTHFTNYKEFYDSKNYI